MNYLGHSLKIGIALTLTLTLSGCPSMQKKATLDSAVESFNKAIESANTTLDTERKSKPRTRRAEAIEYYLLTRGFASKTTDVAVIPDFTPNDEITSFAKFACAGSGSLVREKNAMSYAAAYSAGLKDIMSPGQSTLTGQFSRFSALNKPLTAPQVPNKPKGGQVQDCADNLVSILNKWVPSPTTDPYDENPIAAIPVAITAYQAINSFLTTALTTWNNYESKEKFSRYVQQFDNQFKEVMESDMPEGRIKEAWEHRIAVSLQRPLGTFRQIFRTYKNQGGPEAEADKIRELGLKANEYLAEYDALRLAPAPQDIRKGLLAAQQRLYEAATNDKLSIDQLISFLTGLVDEINDAKKKYEDADKAARALITAIQK